MTIAVKKLHLRQLSDETKEEFLKEAGIMGKLRHPNIVQFFGISMEGGYGILMEYMPKGSLFKVLHSKEDLSWTVRWRIALDIGCGLGYLHGNKILHRDIKSMNVLLDERLRAKLTDFGLAKVKLETNATTTAERKGTTRWMAPELFDMNGSYTKKADVYSYGVVLWELSSREVPYKGAVNDMAVMLAVCKGHRDRIPQGTPAGFGKLIGSCWKQRASERPEAAAVVHEIKKEMNQESSEKDTPM